MRKIRYKRVLCNPVDETSIEFGPFDKPAEAMEQASKYLEENGQTNYWSWWDFESEEVPEEWE